MSSQTIAVESTVAQTAASQFLTFILAGEEYGVDILCVQEVRGWEVATPLPNSAAYVRGVINLRGVIVPIIDLRNRFGLPDEPYTKMNVVIVIKVQAPGKSRVVGLIVDAVSDVVDITPAQRKEAPVVGAETASQFVEGLATVGDKMIILLNIDNAVDDAALGRSGTTPETTAH